MNDIYLHIVARMADYMDTHPYAVDLSNFDPSGILIDRLPGDLSPPLICRERGLRGLFLILSRQKIF